MVLKYLEIQGFKSFPDKTKITFNQGLTAVVGPNGSGKSNISDAIKWVMGEQSNKSLRGLNMEDVIFTGTKTRKSQGFAQVSLSIDNSDKTLLVDSDEVIITRRYSRSGDSDYLINGENVRLKDINELFMDTGLGKDGYAIIGQGKIAEIVQSKSDERRVIFEEAAGISKFRTRRNEAQKKLNLAEENLIRLRDILSELQGRVEPLKEQSQKAQEFIKLSEKKKTVQISIWINTLEKSNKLLKDESDKILARSLEYEQVQLQIEKIEQEIKSTYKFMQQCLIDIDNLRKSKDIYEQEISQSQSYLAVCENNLMHNNNNKIRIKKELEIYNNSQENLKLELIRTQEEKLINSNNIKLINDNIKEKEQELLLLKKKSEDFSNSETLLNKKINNLNISQLEYKMTLNQLETSVEEEKSKFENNTNNLENKKQDLINLEDEFKNISDLSNHLKMRLSQYNDILNKDRLKLKSKEEKLQEHQKEYINKKLKEKELIQNVGLIKQLQENLEGFAYSVKTIISKSKYGLLSGINGTLAQLITVPQQYQTALEIALGQALQNIVVETEQDAKIAINYLKKENLGRATFLPLTSIKGNRLNINELQKERGFIAICSDVLKFENKYQGVISYLLGRIALVDNIDNAVIIARKYGYKFKIVTLDGQVLNVGGAMTGGSKNKSKGFLSRKNDIDKLLQQSQDIKQECLLMKQEESKYQEEIVKIKQHLSKIENEIISINQDIVRCEGEQKRLSLHIAQEKQLLQEMESSLLNYENRMSELNNKIDDTKTFLLNLQKQLEQSKQKLKSLEGQSDDYLFSKNKFIQEISNLKYKKIELKKDIENLNLLIENMQNKNSDSDAQIKRLKQELSQIENQDNQIQTDIENNKNLISDLKDKSKNCQNNILEKISLRNKLEEKTTILRKDEKVLSVQRERLSKELARLEERKLSIQKEYDIIISKLWDEYNLTKSEAMGLCIEVDDISKLNIQLSSLKEKIKTLGNVNVSAIDEYKEVYQRYEFLSKQIKDVEHSKLELLKIIDNLTQTMKEIFLKNFNLINENFKRIFVELFGGGDAKLKLMDNSDVLNCGIEIFVQPPGKIIKSLTLLSGGEQAFIAIAIYFAILKVRPSPFCVLDEIEAALDDVNVIKYASYLRLISDKTQFIMITHRRGTMEEADVLYGVTMQEDGVSKILKLNVSQIEEKMQLE